jgi:hypothetical protein
MKIPGFDTPEARMAWAFVAIVGGCIVFTVFAAVGVYIVRGSNGLSFWLALAAHGQVLVGMTALSFLLGRRVNLDISKEGVKLDDTGGEPPSQSVKVEVTQ